MKYFIFVLSVFFVSGCIPKAASVKLNADNISLNAENISKVFDLINVYHKNDQTDKLKSDMKEVAEKIFQDSLKDNNLLSQENVKKAVEVGGSISEKIGIPYGGLVMDTIGWIVGLFGTAKVAQVGMGAVARRRKEEEDWKNYLASLTPEEAEKAIKANGV